MTVANTQSFRELLGPQQTVSDPAELLTYEFDAGLEHGLPDGVLFPHSASDVVKIVTWAGRNEVTLVARGAGTGTSGGAVAEGGGIVVEFARMNRILEFSVPDRIRVEPGVVNAALDEYLQSHGVFYPPDPASGRVCTLGGNIAENAGGPRCFKYGVTTNYVTGLQVVLADGRLVQFGGDALDLPDYDWVGILTGSEGTLGIITQANLRLLRRPMATTMLMAAFDTVQRAGEAVSDILAHGLVPATIEMMDQTIVRIVEEYSHIGLPVDAGAVLIIQVDGYDAGLSTQVEEISAVLRDHRVRELNLAETDEERESIWRARKDSAGALARLAPAYYASDCTVPRSKIAITLQEITHLCDAHGIPVNYLLHAGDGNLHPNYMVADAGDQELMARIRSVEAQVLAFCVRQGGSITGEHGIGLERRRFMPLMYNGDELQTMRDVKGVFDPHELFNPGKIFPEPLPAPLPLPSVGEPPISPFAPESVEGAVAAIRAWLAGQSPRRLRVRGGGTKSALLPPSDVVLSTAHFTGIRARSAEDYFVTAGAGTPLAQIQEELERDRMWVPLISPWAEATLGGIVSSNFNAPLRMRYGYGGIRDLVLAATIVLPNGRVVRIGRPVVKNVAGYDLVKLFVGAHGTLGLISEVTLKTHALVRARASLLVPVDALELGLNWAESLRRICWSASALLLSRGCNLAGVAAPFELVYTAEGIRQDVAAELEEVQRALRAAHAPEAIRLDQVSGSEWWAAWLGAAKPNETTLRIGMPPRDLPEIVNSTAKTIAGATFMADIANGMLYIKGALNGPELDQIRLAAVAAHGYAVVLDAPTGTKIDRWGYQPEGGHESRAIKSLWDPQGLFNPGAFNV